MNVQTLHHQPAPAAAGTGAPVSAPVEIPGRSVVHIPHCADKIELLKVQIGQLHTSSSGGDDMGTSNGCRTRGGGAKAVDRSLSPTADVAAVGESGSGAPADAAFNAASTAGNPVVLAEVAGDAVIERAAEAPVAVAPDTTSPAAVSNRGM